MYCIGRAISWTRNVRLDSNSRRILTEPWCPTRAHKSTGSNYDALKDIGAAAIRYDAHCFEQLKPQRRLQFNHGRLSHRLVLRLRSRVASRKERGLQTIDVFVIFSQRVLQTRPTNHMTPDRAMGNALKSRHTRSINGRSRLRCSNCIPPVAPCFIQRRFISLQSDFFFLCSAIYFCESAAVIYRVYSFSLNFFLVWLFSFLL